MIPPIATKEDYSKCLFLAVASSQPYILLSETTPAYKLEIYIYIYWKWKCGLQSFRK